VVVVDGPTAKTGFEDGDAVEGMLGLIFGGYAPKVIAGGTAAFGFLNGFPLE